MVNELKFDSEIVEEMRKLRQSFKITKEEVRSLLDKNHINLKEYLAIMYKSNFQTQNQSNEEDNLTRAINNLSSKS